MGSYPVKFYSHKSSRFPRQHDVVDPFRISRCIPRHPVRALRNAAYPDPYTLTLSHRFNTPTKAVLYQQRKGRSKISFRLVVVGSMYHQEKKKQDKLRLRLQHKSHAIHGLSLGAVTRR
ncbi:hypothetical protein ACQKWADRAFT_279984 [Trichoderma austrokoningii]